MVIGLGGFSKVVKVLHKKTKKPFALKVFSKSQIIEKSFEKEVIRERKILTSLTHSGFIVEFYCAFQDKENLYLLFEYLSGGDLRYHLDQAKKMNSSFTMKQIKFFLSCAVLALEHLELNSVVHRDIKPENFLLTEKGYLKLADFSISHYNKSNTSQKKFGTIGYMAPETLFNKQNGLISFVTDYFSFGVMIYEMLFFKTPFKAKSLDEMRQEMYEKDLRICFSSANDKEEILLFDLVNQLLIKDPLKRLGSFGGVEEIKSHEFFQDVDWKKLSQKRVKAEFIPPYGSNYDKEYCVRRVLAQNRKNKKNYYENFIRYQTLVPESKINIFKEFEYFNICDIEKENILSTHSKNVNTFWLPKGPFQKKKLKNCTSEESFFGDAYMKTRPNKSKEKELKLPLISSSVKTSIYCSFQREKNLNRVVRDKSLSFNNSLCKCSSQKYPVNKIPRLKKIKIK